MSPIRTEQTGNKRTLGAGKEALAAAYLEKQGLRILARNFRCRTGEIDLVAAEAGCGPDMPDTLVFVEVKYRKNAACGHPEEAVDLRKQRVICRVALFYLSRYGLSPDTPVRFDVVAVEGERIRWIRDAFSF